MKVLSADAAVPTAAAATEGDDIDGSNISTSSSAATTTTATTTTTRTLIDPTSQRSHTPRDTTHAGRTAATISAADTTTARAGMTASLIERGRQLYHHPPGWLPMVVLLQNQVLFALMHVLAKPALQYLPPISLALMRVSLAVPLLFLLAKVEGSLSKIGRKDASYMVFLGVVGVAFPQTLIFVGNRLAGPNIVAIMAPAAPVYAAIFAAALRLENLTYVKLGGILLAVAGALVVLRPDKMDMNHGHPSNLTAGVFVMVVQTMCYAIFLVALKIKLITTPYPFGIYAYASLCGVIMIGLFSFFTGSANFDASLVPKSAWMAVLYCGIVISFFAHAAQSFAVAHTSASLPALFSCLAPFFTGFLSYLFLHETIGSASDIIGLLLNITGLCAVIYSRTWLEGDKPTTATATATAAPPTTGATSAVLPEQDEDNSDDNEDNEVLPPASTFPRRSMSKLKTLPESTEEERGGGEGEVARAS